jgi:hypothetical protein
MKRAVAILIATLVVFLVYPSTHPSAKTSASEITDGPSVMSPRSHGIPINLSDSGDGDSDDGDSDDVAGGRARDQVHRPDLTAAGAVLNSPAGTGLVFKMWWNFMIWIR